MTDAPETIHIWQLKGSQWKMGGWDLVPESGPAYTCDDLIEARIAAAVAAETERCAALFHDEQLRIWALEIMEALALCGVIDFKSYADKVDAFVAVIAELKAIAAAIRAGAGT